MKNVVIALIAGFALTAGASAFADGNGGGNGGERTHQITMDHLAAAKAAKTDAEQTAKVQAEQKAQVKVTAADK
jgi:hypothetical protein